MLKSGKTNMKKMMSSDGNEYKYALKLVSLVFIETIP